MIWKDSSQKKIANSLYKQEHSVLLIAREIQNEMLSFIT